jgi:hypothetical protein
MFNHLLQQPRHFSFLTARLLVIWALSSVFSAVLCMAQTVSPLIDENVVKGPGKVAKGKIDYFNDSLQPLTVVLEAKSFAVSYTGEISYGPLGDSIRLKLSAMSFRIPPKQSYTVFYEASADKLPVWFVLYASFSGFRERTADGFRIQVQLPHTIYLLKKQSIQKNELAVITSEYIPKDKKVVVRVRNNGDAFGRVLETNVSGKGAGATQGGFPLFPQAERQVEIPWEGDAQPSRIVLHLAHFKVEHTVNTVEP